MCSRGTCKVHVSREQKLAETCHGVLQWEIQEPRGATDSCLGNLGAKVWADQHILAPPEQMGCDGV